jgi:hypothetical protein
MAEPARPKIVQLLQNPFYDEINLQNADAASLSISLADLSGRRLWHENRSKLVANAVVNLKPDVYLPNGMYILSVSNGNASETFKLIKE